MKILLLTQLFQPEPNHLKGLAFAQHIKRCGHEIEVLTGYPNYPSGKLYPGYTLHAVQREVIGGIRVTRTLMYPSHDASPFRRMLTYLTFAVSATLAGLVCYRRGAFDIVHVYHGPATLMLPGMVLAWWTRARLVLDVQDLWPESVSSSGMLSSHVVMRMLDLWSRRTYRAADRIIVLSHGYKDLIAQRGARPETISVIYNWCDEAALHADAGIPDELCHLKYQGKSIVLYAGTMGRIQGLESVIDAAALLMPLRSDIHFVFVGSGVEIASLKRHAAEKKAENVSFFPRVEPVKMGALFAWADALLIHLKKGDLGAIGIPQKIQAYLAAGKPVIMAANGEAGLIMKASKAAVCCEPENPGEIADAVRRLFMKPRDERDRMGENGASYYRATMSFETGVAHVIETYIAAAKRRSGAMVEATGSAMDKDEG